MPREDGTRSTTLDLPPATVGPLSLRIAAATGDASAEFEVAARLAEGKGTNQNFKEAVRWYQRSAAQGFAQAQHRIGTMYERGLGVRRGSGPGQGLVSARRRAGQREGHARSRRAQRRRWRRAPTTAGATELVHQGGRVRACPDSQYNLAVLSRERASACTQDQRGGLQVVCARGSRRRQGRRRPPRRLEATLSARNSKLAEALVAGFTAKPVDPLANDARAAGEDWKKRANSDG